MFGRLNFSCFYYLSSVDEYLVLYCFLYFSEGEFETFYYSYPSHLEELIKCLKDDGFEKPLVQTLEEKYDIMIQQMKCTEELTNAAKGNSFDE